MQTTELRPRHAQENQTLRLKQQALERSLLKLETIIHPEFDSKNVNNNQSKRNASNEVAQLSEHIRREIKDIELAIPSERDPAKREIAKKRVENFCQRLMDLETKSKDHKWTQAARERNDLFDGYDPEAATALSEAGEESKSLKHSNTAMNEVLQVGMSILTNLADQREGLKRATNRMEDMAGNLGISNSLLRAVRRRQFGDAMIVYGGIALVTVILYLFYCWVHR